MTSLHVQISHGHLVLVSEQGRTRSRKSTHQTAPCQRCQDWSWSETVVQNKSSALHLQNNLAALNKAALATWVRMVYKQRTNTYIDRYLGSVRVLDRGIIALDPFVVDKLSCIVIGPSASGVQGFRVDKRTS